MSRNALYWQTQKNETVCSKPSSVFESLLITVHIINPVDKTKLPCNTPHRRSTKVSLEAYHFYLLSMASNLWSTALLRHDNRKHLAKIIPSLVLFWQQTKYSEIAHCHITSASFFILLTQFQTPPLVFYDRSSPTHFR